MIKKNLNLDLKFRYYKHLYCKKILFTRPIKLEKKSHFEVHILTCEKDFINAMWCLKTFYHFFNKRPPLVIHDDGSLSKESIYEFERHFVKCKVIAREDADREVNKILKNYEYCLKYRFNRFMIHSIKLFDSLVCTEENGFLILDSDVLFFRRPDEMISCIDNNQGFFMEDFQNAYSFETDHIFKLLGIKVRDKVNTGIVFFPNKNIFDFNLVESFLKEAYCQDYPKKSWLEQTAFGLLFSKYNDNFRKLGKDYQISNKAFSDRTVSHHFVADGSRNNFYMDGLKRLKKNKFLKSEEIRKANKTLIRNIRNSVLESITKIW